MNFWKMNGAGNDFIILDGIKESIDIREAGRLAVLLCERHLSIGADGLMLVLASRRPEADYRMAFFNSDGSIGEMCGNGARCICRYGYENGLSGEVQKVDTDAGLVTGIRIGSQNYRIRLNDPTAVDLCRRVNIDGNEYETAYVELGNPGIPHAVLQLPERFQGAVGRLLHPDRNHLQQEADTKLLGELRELGRKLRFAPVYPKGANVNFCTVTDTDTVDLITFERGVEDFTYACGTGTGSTAYVLNRRGLCGNRNVKVTNRGGLLSVDDTEEGLFLTGPTNIVAVGEVKDENYFPAEKQ